MNLTEFYYTNMNKQSKCVINDNNEIEIGGKLKQHHTNNYDSQNGSNPKKGKSQQQQPDIDHNPQLWETNFRATKIRNLGYKSKKRELERKNLSSRWSWPSESSANRSSMVALCSPCTAFSRCCTPFVFLASNVLDVTVEERREVVEVTMEERREVMNGLHCLRSCSWPASWVEEKWDRYGHERERKENGGEWEIWQREQSTKIKHTPLHVLFN